MGKLWSLWREDEQGRNVFVFSDWQSLCEIICQVGDACAPENDELALRHSVLDPVEAHVDGLAMLLLNAVMRDPDGTAVVAQDDGWRLRVAEVVQDGAQLGTVLGIHEQAGELGFGCRRDDNRYDGGRGEDGAVGQGGAIDVAEVEQAAVDGATARAGQVRAVGLDMQNHVARAQFQLCVGMGGGVREQSVDLGPDGGAQVGLAGGDVVDGG